MRYDEPELQEALACSYVAGALQGLARRRFEALMHTRPALRQRVEAWENRLTPLADGTPEVQPPARVWRAIQGRIAPQAAAAQSVGWWHSLAFWRPFGALAAVLALVVTGYTGYVVTRPAAPPQVAEVSPQQVAPSYVAVLEDEADQPALVVTAFKGPWRLIVEPLRDLASYESPEGGKVFQIWAVERDTGTTRPLLQVTGGAVLRLPLDESGWVAIKTSESLVVTLEDAGSTPAAPSSPAIFSGLCLNLKGPEDI
ncbi:MAG: anti-sigma factor domain-containing protein [Kiloniellaceae bacterium]